MGNQKIAHFLVSHEDLPELSGLYGVGSDVEDFTPSVGVFGFAVLDGAEGVVESRRHLAGFAVFGEYERFTGVEVVDLADGGADGRCAASGAFFEGREFFDGNVSAFDVPCRGLLRARRDSCW